MNRSKDFELGGDMQPIHFLLAANLAVWAGISIYLAFLGQKCKQNLRRVQQLETEENGLS
ncbi:MAG: CcmD family protein [Desulfohalobiaceae bacterium]